MVKRKAGSNEKIYNGKIYKRHGQGVIPTESKADKIVDELHKKGYNAVKQYRSRQKAYLVWKRKKGK